MPKPSRISVPDHTTEVGTLTAADIAAVVEALTGSRHEDTYRPDVNIRTSTQYFPRPSAQRI